MQVASLYPYIVIEPLCTREIKLGVGSETENKKSIKSIPNLECYSLLVVGNLNDERNSFFSFPKLPSSHVFCQRFACKAWICTNECDKTRLSFSLLTFVLDCEYVKKKGSF